MRFRSLIAAIAFLALPPAFYGQDAEKVVSCRDMPVREMWENVRVLPPVTLAYYDGIRIEYVISAKEGISVGALAVDSKTDLPDGFRRDYKKKTWWVVYCNTDRTVLFIQDFDLGQKFLETRQTRRKKI